jgi:hypothetical protein
MRTSRRIGIGVAILGALCCPCFFRSVHHSGLASRGPEAPALATTATVAATTLPELLGSGASVFTSTNGPLRKPDSESDFLRELSRLHRVDKAGALALAEQGDAWYPSTGPFAEARHAMTVTLLVDLGDMDAARRITRALIADNPRSPYLPLVEGVTGIHPRPHGPASTL